MLFGPLIFHSLGLCTFTRTFIILGFAFMYVENTTFHECLRYFIIIFFRANFIRLAFHSCMLKNTTFHEWDFCKIFISFLNTLVLMAVLLVSGKQTQPRQLRAETQINREACPTKALLGKGPPCHKSSSRLG